jgi:hypothetical protein
MDNLFAFHKLNTQGQEKATIIACWFVELISKLATVCPESREFSITKTKLEEACFFAKKAMAVQLLNQDIQVKE